MSKVKICGLQRPDHALVAAEAGADFIGLVFVPGRRRCLEEEQARHIIDFLKQDTDNPLKIVGLFADQPLAEVNHMVCNCHLDMVQLCGRESLEYCGQVAVPVIKVLHVNTTATIEESIATMEDRMVSLANQGHLVTLDRLVEGLQGGTGATFNWQVASELSHRGYKFLLAGGLTPDNVASAIRASEPWGVDVSSGVETNGVKDPEKIGRFVSEARRVDLDRGRGK